MSEDIARTLNSIAYHLTTRKENGLQPLFHADLPDRLIESVREIAQQSLTEDICWRLKATLTLPVMAEGPESADDITELAKRFDHLVFIIEAWNRHRCFPFVFHLTDKLRPIHARLKRYAESINQTDDVCELQPD